MAMYCDIFEPSGDVNESLERLSKVFAPLYGRAWEEDKKATYEGKPFDPSIPTIARMWLDKALKIFIVYDGPMGKPIGFLMGAVFRPMPYQANVFQIDDWYTGGDPVMQDILFGHVKQAIRYIGCDEIWMTDNIGRVPDMSDTTWKLSNEFSMKRFTRK